MQGYLTPGYGSQPGQQWRQPTPGYNMPPGQPQGGFIPTGPQPPRRKRHVARNVILGIVGAFVLIIIIGAIASSLGGNKNTGSPASGSATTQVPASTQASTGPTYTAGETQFYNDVQSTWSQIAGGTEAQIVSVGNQLCQARQDGATQQQAIDAARQKFGGQDKNFVLNVEKDLCPSEIPTGPTYTVSQQQAIIAAEGYLSDGQGFSKVGLVQQLDSSYGNGFSYADAVFAVNHVQVDWFQQAVISAKGYMNSGQGFSCSSLVQQLNSSYGSNFTLAQARYAAKAVGLGSC